MIIKLILPGFLLVISLAAGILLPGNRNTVIDESVSLLPALTTTGINSFGCLINNEVWVEHQLEADLSKYGNMFCFSIELGEAFENRIAFVIDEQKIETGAYDLNRPPVQYVHMQKKNLDCNFTSDEFYNGVLVVHHHDPDRKILTATFEFLGYSENCQEAVRVTNGRFDVSYNRDYSSTLGTLK